jgi:hypothetical protein
VARRPVPGPDRQRHARALRVDAREDAGAAARLARIGNDLEEMAAELEAAGLRAFGDAYAEVLDAVAWYVAGDRRAPAEAAGARLAPAMRAGRSDAA